MFRPRGNAESKNGVRVPHPVVSGQQSVVGRLRGKGRDTVGDTVGDTVN
jgi:hypothetical protein